MKKFACFGSVLVVSAFLGCSDLLLAQESLFKEYSALVVEPLEVAPNSPAPDSAGAQAAEKVVFQVRRYSQKYHLFEIIVKEGVQEIPPEQKTLVVRGTVKEYTQPSVGRRIGRSFLPGGEFTGTAAFAARYQFIDKESGKVIYETDLRTTASGRNDTVDYAMERNGEALAKVILKLKGK